jgi:hypothetical protein
MFSPKKLIQIFVITTCLFVVGVTSSPAKAADQGQAAYPNWWGQSTFPGMGGYGGMHPMFNPAMWTNPMTWMNPGNYMSLMNPMVWMNPANYMQMMNPMAYMGMMMNPMMYMMNPMAMMNPMGMMNPMAMGGYGNPMGQMPGGQMMDPKQYEQWFKQWSEMMENMTKQMQPSK